MSNRRRLKPTNPASMAIRRMDGARIPGGCDHCDAYQVVRADYWGANLHSIEVRHDDWCPWLAASTNPLSATQSAEQTDPRGTGTTSGARS